MKGWGDNCEGPILPLVSPTPFPISCENFPESLTQVERSGALDSGPDQDLGQASALALPACSTLPPAVAPAQREDGDGKVSPGCAKVPATDGQ